MHGGSGMVVFINGFPLTILEFKSFNANETAKMLSTTIKQK